MPKCISYSTVGYKLEVPDKVNSFREVREIANEVKYLTWRLRKTARYLTALDELERARDVMERSGVKIDQDDFGKAIEAIGRDIVAAFNSYK